MPSQCDNSVSPEIGQLLELLNAFEKENWRGVESFATLEHLLAEGRECPQNPADLEVDHATGPEDWQQATHNVLAMSAEEQAARDGHASQPTTESEAQRSAGESVENRFAAHIVRGMWKTKRD